MVAKLVSQQQAIGSEINSPCGILTSNNGGDSETNFVLCQNSQDLPFLHTIGHHTDWCICRILNSTIWKRSYLKMKVELIPTHNALFRQNNLVITNCNTVRYQRQLTLHDHI